MAKKTTVNIQDIILYFATTILGLIFTWSVIEWVVEMGYSAKYLTIASGIGITLLIIFGYYKTK